MTERFQRTEELRRQVAAAIRRAAHEAEYMENRPEEECGTPLQLELDKWREAGDELFELTQEGYYKFLLGFLDKKPTEEGDPGDSPEVRKLKRRIREAVNRAVEEQHDLFSKQKTIPSHQLCETSLLGAIGNWHRAQAELRSLRPHAELLAVLTHLKQGEKQ
jgi:hypothetical protein